MRVKGRKKRGREDSDPKLIGLSHTIKDSGFDQPHPNAER